MRNELAVLPLFWARLRRVRRALRPCAHLHLVFVDDASSDGSGAWLAALAHRDRAVRVMHLSSCVGQQCALLAGYAQAPGRAVISLDVDLQDPPEAIGDMLALWRGGADVVYGVRVRRLGDTLSKRTSAALFYRFLAAVSPHTVALDAGDFRLMDRRIVRFVQRMPQHRPYVRGMVACAGGRQVALRYERAARSAGTSHYDLAAMGRLAWAGIFHFASPWRTAFVSALGTTLAFAPFAYLRHQNLFPVFAVCLCVGGGLGFGLALAQRSRSDTGSQHSACAAGAEALSG